MRATTAPEAILRSICRRLRAEGARMSVYAASETNGIATGTWPGVCEEIGLVLVGEEGRIQVQAGQRVGYVALGAEEVAGLVITVLHDG
jgi:hypothetical protein